MLYEVITQAREGAYRERALRQVEAHYREHYFRRAGEFYVIEPRVRNLVRFGYLNLQESSYPDRNNFV